ncbi:hypothetical protein [Allobaculum mucilyticum]|uniref:hypothetical protein n=1 Tax=Allobaculum mucilyticum TaxID=2834459 RepID=UPI001E5164CB|nr:hypothetical protein [Allobaculum mucilyticum]UNT96818.1 hypothetical protein KWG62_03425 [Allobaculum mucilyticum]
MTNGKIGILKAERDPDNQCSGWLNLSIISSFKSLIFLKKKSCGGSSFSFCAFLLLLEHDEEISPGFFTAGSKEKKKSQTDAESVDSDCGLLGCSLCTACLAS